MDLELIPRIIYDELQAEVRRGKKVVLLFGPRQIGKTTLLKQLTSTIQGKVLFLNADETQVRDVFSSGDLKKLSGAISGMDVLMLDEAQRIENIGINLKLLHDNFPQLSILVTGSSTLELANRTQEPLTGRTWTFHLFPISIGELSSRYNDFELRRNLPEWLIYGMYPEVFSIKNYNRKAKYLQELTQSYLYKDVLELASIRYPAKLKNLLRLLAFQIGNEVSYSELGNSLGLAKETVESYINLLEKSFVIFRLGGFSRNLRKEVTKMDKIYFYDLGIRNSLIDNLNSLESRDDVGQLWENFLIVERMKKLSYKFESRGRYFWRTYTKVELDYVEEGGGKIFGFEFKWNPKKLPKVPSTWRDAYPKADYQVITPDNFLDFVR